MNQRSISPQTGWATAITASSTTKKEELGIVRWTTDATVGLRAYRYIQAAADTTVADGTCLGYSDTSRFIASEDIGNSDFVINQVAGVGIGEIVAESYGWVQCYGYHAAVLTNGDDDITDGDTIIIDASNDGVCNSTASGTPPVSTPIGVAVADDVNDDDTVAAFLSCI